jgi:hypothetical protein
VGSSSRTATDPAWRHRPRTAPDGRAGQHGPRGGIDGGGRAP